MNDADTQEVERDFSQSKAREESRQRGQSMFVESLHGVLA